MTNLTIDINCDVGERATKYDEVLFPYITSANVSCGVHAGDLNTIAKTLTVALGQNLQVGAHPSYPDREGFGRRKMQMDPDDLREEIRLQIVDIKEIVERIGVFSLGYVKPHGALYNVMADNADESRIVLEAIQLVDKKLAVMGLAGSVTAQVAAEMKVQFIAEAFADRRYTSDGRLQSRMEDGAVIVDPSLAAKQALSIAKNECVTTAEGATIPIKAQSICIHGDNLAALDIVKEIRKTLTENGITIKPF